MESKQKHSLKHTSCKVKESKSDIKLEVPKYYEINKMHQVLGCLPMPGFSKCQGTKISSYTDGIHNQRKYRSIKEKRIETIFIFSINHILNKN